MRLVGFIPVTPQSLGRRQLEAAAIARSPFPELPFRILVVRRLSAVPRDAMVPPMKIHTAVSAFRARPVTALAALIAFAAISNAALVGCGSKPAENASTDQTQTTDQTAQTTPPAGEPSGDLGAQVYAQRCVLCHGATGHGDGPASASLNPKPRNHTDGSYMNGRTSDELLQVIREGKGAMPAWKSVLSEEEIQAVLKHVRSLAVPPYQG